MRATRLRHAIDSGGIALPATGRLLLIGPDMVADADPLPRDRLTVVARLRPVHDAFAAAGHAVQPDATGLAGFAAAIVCLPRAREAGRARVAAAAACVAPGAPVIVEGARTDGIETLLRECRAAGMTLGEAVSKAHGKVFAIDPAAVPADWAARPRPVPGGFVTLPGVFSADGPDRGSALLAAALPPALPRRVIDLGAGWGYLAAAALAREGVERLDLVEADHDALACARLNVTDPRAQFHWADATTFRPAAAAEAVLCNPPFHRTRAAEPDLGRAFIAAAAGMLTRGGTLWLVANRHLPYRDVLAQRFRESAEIGGDGVFALWRATGPVAAAAAAPARPAPRRAARS
jgi:16S rRNA (guanine1207-N2)-methyltransferase